MIVFRRRLIFWLIRAYFKKWGKTILVFFILGLLVFFALRYFVRIIPSAFPFLSRETVGIAGTYTINDLPPSIFYKISRGLTFVDKGSVVRPDIAKSWKIGNNGKEYTFYLKNNIYFADGTHFTSKYINYNFKDTQVKRPDDYTITFVLKEPYSPFPVTVARPIFKKGFVGVGDYRVKYIKFNGDFVSSIDLVSNFEPPHIIRYQFFPTEEALKMGFVVGDVSRALGINDPLFKGKKLTSFKSVKSSRSLDEKKLVTVFYNTKDPTLSDKRVREAFFYAMPDAFEDGERNSSPFSPSSWASTGTKISLQDLVHARELISSSESASKSSGLTFTLKTLPQHRKTANIIKENFKKINAILKIEEVDSVPSQFQLFLGDYNLPKDPDQYTLWHSEQTSNITGYKNLRIDKLLEDGRRVSDINERKKIYTDFEKYLLDDPPASFLYLPYTYTIFRD